MNPTKKVAAKRVVKKKPAKRAARYDRTKWDIIFGKMKKLATAMEMYWGPGMNIDDVQYRWVDDRIKYYEKDRRLLTKEEMDSANQMWKKYNV